MSRSLVVSRSSKRLGKGGNRNKRGGIGKRGALTMVTSCKNTAVRRRVSFSSNHVSEECPKSVTDHLGHELECLYPIRSRRQGKELHTRDLTGCRAADSITRVEISKECSSPTVLPSRQRLAPKGPLLVLVEGWWYKLPSVPTATRLELIRAARPSHHIFSSRISVSRGRQAAMTISTGGEGFTGRVDSSSDGYYQVKLNGLTTCGALHVVMRAGHIVRPGA
ncbi:hypothetical protein IW261DRAFT_1666043 [Armillaria novae-zelandiae]|uniref:Uncharacterized protein n=1 Tax=Armillaria novae-zelandiae TaxID=153914 RepID=A0AA39U109_9AGAR|nr:hypothetical protein IW261DRAFT_1666043 [Armillaria novae-zelandiae]